MDFEIGVVGVGFARQQRLELPPFAFDLQRLQRRDPLGLGRCVALRLAKFDQGYGVVQVALHFGERAQPILQRRPLAHEGLRGLGVVPEAGVLGFCVQFGQSSRR